MNPIPGENDQTPSKTVYHVTCDFKLFVRICKRQHPEPYLLSLEKHNESVTSSIYKIK